MKILIISHEYPPVGGGGGVAVFDLVQELAKRKSIKIDVLTVGGPSLKNVEKCKNVTMYRIKTISKCSLETNTAFLALLSYINFVILGIIYGIKLMMLEKYDVIHSHFIIPSGIIGSVLSFIFFVPHIVTVYEADILNPKKGCRMPYNFCLRWLITFLFKFSSCVVTISHHIQKEVIDFYYKNIRKLEVIHLGINLQENLIISERQKYNLDEKDFVITTIGRLVERKGIKFLVKAVSEIKDNNVKLIIIGEGPQKVEIQNFISQHKLSDRVMILGRVSEKEKKEILSLSDIFVLPSLHEGFGLVILEAMEYGLPVITTNHGGQTEIIEDQTNGFLIPVGNWTELKEKILLLRQNKNLWHQIYYNNKSKVKSFSVKDEADKYINIYKRILQ